MKAAPYQLFQSAVTGASCVTALGMPITKSARAFLVTLLLKVNTP